MLQPIPQSIPHDFTVPARRFRALDEQDQLPLGRIGCDTFRQFQQKAGPGFLISLGQFTGEHGPSIAENRRQICQTRLYAGSGFEEDQRSGYIAKGFDLFLARDHARRKKAGKKETVGWKTRFDQSRQNRTCARQGEDINLGLDSRANQPETGVAHERRSRIRNQRNPFPLLETFYQAGNTFRRIMVMIG